MKQLRMLALALVLAGCGSDEAAGPGGSAGTATLSGSLAASDGRIGSLTLTGQVPSALVATPPRFEVVGGAAAPAAVINLTGTVSLSDGSTATLTGTWDNVSGALSVSGGGFTFSGTLTAGHLSGAFTGPSVTGVFSLQLSTTATDVAVYCGTYTGREPEDLPSGSVGNGPDNGTWNLVVGAATVDVVVLSDEGEPLALSGTRSGNAITLTVPSGQATGTLSGAASEFVKGNYTIAGGLSGTFQGSTAACTATAESAAIASITLNHPGLQSGSGATFVRLAFDSTLVFATAKDAAGNYVAAPNLDWSYTGFARSNSAVTPKGQKWMVWTGTGSTSVTAKSHNNPSVSATFTVIAQ